MDLQRSFSVLTDAISDVGCWAWWAEDLPRRFQIEFDGTQLLISPATNEHPPSNKLAVCFENLLSVAFLTKVENTSGTDWPKLLQEDKVDCQTITFGKFAINDKRLIKQILAEASEIVVRFGLHPEKVDMEAENIALAFWAGTIGCFVAATSIQLFGREGDIDIQEIPAMNEAWWNYWRKYWEVRSTSNPLPKDYACEVTVPIGS